MPWSGRLQFKAGRLLISLIILAGLTYLFVHLARGIDGDSLHRFDLGIIQVVQGSINDMSTNVLLLLTSLGTIKGNIVLVVLFSIWFIWKRHYLSTAFLLFVCLSGAYVNKYLKWTFQRERPSLNPLVVENGFSFPSGHSMSSFILYGALMIIATRMTKNWHIRLPVYVVCTVMIILMGYSRIYLGVHYPSDVLAGYAAGGVWLVITAEVFKYWEYRGGKKKR